MRDRGRLLVAVGLGMAVLLVGCTVERSAPPTFARYHFRAGGIAGVLEVTRSPASICYSTQSASARPISILRAWSPRDEQGVTEVSFVPHVNDFCDRAVSPSLADGLIAHPTGYHVRWRPMPNGPSETSALLTSLDPAT